jgi:hypothetical protein
MEEHDDRERSIAVGPDDMDAHRAARRRDLFGARLHPATLVHGECGRNDRLPADDRLWRPARRRELATELAEEGGVVDVHRLARQPILVDVVDATGRDIERAPRGRHAGPFALLRPR